MTQSFTIDQFCDKFEYYEGLFIKPEPVDIKVVEEYLDLFVQWSTLEETEDYKECCNDGIFAQDIVIKRLSAYPSHLGKLYFILGHFDACVDLLQSLKLQSNDYLYLGLGYMLIERYLKANEIFKAGGYDELASIMHYYLGILDKHTKREFKNEAYLTNIFESLNIKVIQQRQLVLFSGDAQNGLLFRRCVGYFTKLTGNPDTIYKLGQLDKAQYDWTMEVMELNNMVK